MMIIQQPDLKETLRSITQDQIYRTACLDSIALVTNRIQNEGDNSKGGKIGEYKPFSAKNRAKRGRQTQFIDLTDSGQMIDSLAFEKTNENEYAIGFSSKAAADKAEWNEARFGDVFALTKEEINLVTEAIEKNVGAAIRG